MKTYSGKDTEMKILAEEEKVKDEVGHAMATLLFADFSPVQIVEATANEASQAEQSAASTLASTSFEPHCASAARVAGCRS